MKAHVIYDAGALIAADKNQPAFMADHRIRLRRGIMPLVPAPVLSQVWAPGSKHATLHRVINGCDVLPYTEDEARDVAALCRNAGSCDVVDGFVAHAAIKHGHATIITSDVEDIRGLLAGKLSTARILVRKP
jgi:hypothetical protein